MNSLPRVFLVGHAVGPRRGRVRKSIPKWASSQGSKNSCFYLSLPERKQMRGGPRKQGKQTGAGAGAQFWLWVVQGLGSSLWRVGGGAGVLRNVSMRISRKELTLPSGTNTTTDCLRWRWEALQTKNSKWLLWGISGDSREQRKSIWGIFREI